MIRVIGAGSGVMAYIGKGTVSIRVYPLTSRFGGQVELTQCLETPIGDVPNNLVANRKKIVLDFCNLKSLDVMIEKLQQLKEEIIDVEEKNNN